MENDKIQLQNALQNQENMIRQLQEQIQHALKDREDSKEKVKELEKLLKEKDEMERQQQKYESKPQSRIYTPSSTKGLNMDDLFKKNYPPTPYIPNVTSPSKRTPKILEEYKPLNIQNKETPKIKTPSIPSLIKPQTSYNIPHLNISSHSHKTNYSNSTPHYIQPDDPIFEEDKGEKLVGPSSFQPVSNRTPFNHTPFNNLDDVDMSLCGKSEFVYEDGRATISTPSKSRLTTAASQIVSTSSSLLSPPKISARTRPTSVQSQNIINEYKPLLYKKSNISAPQSRNSNRSINTPDTPFDINSTVNFNINTPKTPDTPNTPLTNRSSSRQVTNNTAPHTPLFITQQNFEDSLDFELERQSIK